MKKQFTHVILYEYKENKILKGITLGRNEQTDRHTERERERERGGKETDENRSSKGILGLIDESYEFSNIRNGSMITKDQKI